MLFVGNARSAHAPRTRSACLSVLTRLPTGAIWMATAPCLQNFSLCPSHGMVRGSLKPRYVQAQDSKPILNPKPPKICVQLEGSTTIRLFFSKGGRDFFISVRRRPCKHRSHESASRGLGFQVLWPSLGFGVPYFKTFFLKEPLMNRSLYFFKRNH